MIETDIKRASVIDIERGSEGLFIDPFKLDSEEEENILNKSIHFHEAQKKSFRKSSIKISNVKSVPIIKQITTQSGEFDLKYDLGEEMGEGGYGVVHACSLKG